MKDVFLEAFDRGMSDLGRFQSGTARFVLSTDPTGGCVHMGLRATVAIF